MLSIPFFACLPTFTPMRTVFSIFFFLPRHFIHGNTDWIARKRWGRHKKKSRKFQTKQKEEEIGRWLRDGKENGAPLPRAPRRNEALILTCSFACAHLHALPTCCGRLRGSLDAKDGLCGMSVPALPRVAPLGVATPRDYPLDYPGSISPRK